MSLSVVIGISFVVIFFFIFAKNLEKKHVHLKNFLMLLSFFLIFLIPATLTLEQSVCELVVNETEEYYQYGDNFTSAHWDTYSPVPYDDSPSFNPSDKAVFMFHRFTYYDYEELCYDVPNGSTGFLKAYSVVLVLFLTYILIFYFGQIMDALKGVVKKT